MGERSVRKRKVVLFIASSLDGFIATKNESMDWLEKVEGEGDNGYSQFYDTVDTLILGKNTYNWIVRQGLDQFPTRIKNAMFYQTLSIKIQKTSHLSAVTCPN